MPKMQIPKVLLPALKSDRRFIVLIGGRGSGKSLTIADIMLMKAQTEGARIGCFREFMNSIDDSVHALLASEIERLELQGFEVLNNTIRHENGAEFKFKGLARNPEAIKSAHDFKYFFVEEAQTISQESLKNLTPTLRTEGSQLWFAANLRSMSDHFSQRFFKPFEKELRRNKFYEDDLHTIIWVNYTDNPFFPDVLEQERKRDERELDKALYNHIWLGETYDDVENSIIPVEWFDAAIDAHIKLGFRPEGAIISAHDPSDEGGDSKGYALRHGSVVLDVNEKTAGDVNDGLDWALQKAIDAGSDWFVWDADGMGVSLKREVERGLEGKKLDFFMFKGSESPENNDKNTYTNKRAEYYWRLRDRFFNTYRAVEKGEYIAPDDMISLSSSISCLDQLRSEVCRIPLKRNNNGKIQIMTKLEMSKKPYELPSPNMADALMMSMYAPKPKDALADFDFEGWG